ncbi:MAG: radical SAM protein [Bacteroidota bacterium]
MDKILVLNPDYILRNDVKRVIITTQDGEGVTSFIHPLQAMILSFFDNPIDVLENIKRVSNQLNLKEEDVSNFVSQITNNSDKIWIGEGDNACHFPENILVEKPIDYKDRRYHFRDFLMDGEKIDLSAQRFFLPIETILMINSICYTDCVYCYADRNYKFDSKIPFERLCEIVDEAKALKFRKFDISGGEFFMYKNWERLLTKIVTNGFNPTIPTKIPLSFHQIKKIKDSGLKQIQISLDSSDPVHLSALLKVAPDYWERINSTFKDLENVELKFRVNTIVSSLNCNFEEIDKLIQYLFQYEYFVEISIGIVAYTLYKSNNQNKAILPNKAKVESFMESLIKKYGNNKKVKISEASLHKDNFHFSKEDFFKKAICTGNLQAFYILADGKVTLCEELYWYPEFIIGDLTKQSILEMWNSDKALELYHLRQNKISDNSACKRCEYFDVCHKSGSKCWREILKVYGKANWDYPDPRCPFSPEPINNVYIG